MSKVTLNKSGSGTAIDDTQQAINDLIDAGFQAQINDVVSDLSTHEALTAAHGATGAVVGTTNAQTLTNKTLTSPVINSPMGIVKADVGLSNVDNTSDATKNSDTVTLTNKTISGSSNTLTNISLSSSVTGTLPATNGGTSQSSYVIGDLLYASSTTALSKLAIGTNGQYLKSNGAGLAPSWITPASSLVVTSGAYKASTQSIAHNTATVLKFTTQEFDVDSMYNTTTGKVTIASGKDGKYVFAVSAVFSSASWPAGTTADIFLYKNGTSVYQIDRPGELSAATTRFLSLHGRSPVMNLVATDEITMVVTHSQGAALTLLNDLSRQWFSFEKVG